MPGTDVADVLILGGGIVGLSIAHALSREGVRDVCVLERDRCGQGSTAKATGGIRTQFGSPINVVLSLRSLEHYRTWSERYGGTADYRAIGYLFLATNERQLASQSRGLELQHSLGARAKALTVEDIAARVPGVDLRSVVGGTFGPDDGLGDPGAAVGSLRSACLRSGVRVEEDVGTAELETASGRATGVLSPRGRFAADRIVLATGAWTGPICAPLGVTIPITPHHRQVYRAVRRPGVADRTPLVVDLGTGVYFHADGEGLIFGGGDRDTAPSWDDRFLPEEAPRIVELLTRRLPRMLDAPLGGGWAGLREMTPDDVGIVGLVPGWENLHVAAGFSGHGFMHAPAVGEIVACQLLDRRPPFDVSALDPGRFGGEAQGEPYAF